MPTYDYACSECGTTEERKVLIENRDYQLCECGWHLTRLPAAPSIAFKGTGWYVSDYKNKR